MRPGTQVGPYEVIEAIGRGGMGEVFRAFDPRLRRHVAIKTLTTGAEDDPRHRERFEREARAIAAISHPNILSIFDVGVHDGTPYIAVELLEGETLRARIGGAPLSLPTVIDDATAIARGLAAAHEHGIVHRDLKPDNVFVTRDGQIKILDFGLATEAVSESGDKTTALQYTEQGMLLGTAGYMSPEQARGERATPRSDVFAFGCVLYEMLSGRRAFKGESRIETLHAILKNDPPDVMSLRGDAHPTLDQIVRRCLEKDPERRFQSARELLSALEVTRPVAAARSQRTSVWILSAAVVLLAVAGVWWTVSHRSASPSAGVAVSDSMRRLAVLPFENLSGDASGSFAAGMTEEISTQLSKLNALRVMSRTAVAAFKNGRNDLPAMVRDLGIGSVVTGTVRQDGPRVRVNVELIDARSKELIWTEQYDRTGVDVFTVQSDIALRVADALHAKVTLDEQTRVGKNPTTSVAAYDLFVRARKSGGASLERVTAALDLLHQAVNLDPNFAEAYSEIANLEYFHAAYGDLSALTRGLDAAHKALAIDPQLASAHRGLALNLQQMGRLGEALPSYRKAVQLDPSYSAGFSDLSLGEATAGRFDASLDAARHVRELNPSAAADYHIGCPLLSLDDDERTEQFLTASATQHPRDVRIQVLLSMLDLRRGRPQPALDRMRAIVEKQPNNIEGLLVQAEVATFVGAPDAAKLVGALMPTSADGLFHSAPYSVKLAQAYHLRRAGAIAESSKLLDEILVANRTAISGGADWPMVFMQNAAVHALRGETAAALDELDRAYRAGWRDGRLLAIDPLVASLRAEPRFKKVLADIAADVAAMRARADYAGL